MNALTFSTLACPSWSLKTIFARAVEFGYEGIEWRGGPQGHVQPAMTPPEKANVREMCNYAVTAQRLNHDVRSQFTQTSTLLPA